MNRIVAVLEARMGSSRLPGKSMRPLAGAPLVERVLERLRRARALDVLVVATTDKGRDDLLAEHVRSLGVPVYRGSEDDVLARILGASREFCATLHVQCWGDCPFLDPGEVDRVVNELVANPELDLVGNGFGDGRTLPYGLDVIAMRVPALERAERETGGLAYHREHGSTFLYETPGAFACRRLETPGDIRYPKLNLSINTDEEFRFVEGVYEALYPTKPDFGIRDVIAYIRIAGRARRASESTSRRGLGQPMDLRVGIIGCGKIAGTPSPDGSVALGCHAGACREVAGLRLVAAVEPDESRLLAFGRHWEVPALYTDMREMLARERLDLVLVATPPEAHEAACMAAIEHGARGIFCEKPLTGAADGARRIVTACRRAGTKLVVNFTRRWDGSHRELAARIAAAEIGEITSVRGTYTGTLRGNGSHLVDTMGMLVPGAWTIEWASGLHPESTDGAVAAVLRRGTARAFLMPAEPAEYFVFELEIYATRGRARVTFHGNDIRLDAPRSHVEYPGYRFLVESTALPRDTMRHAAANALRALTSAMTSGADVEVDAEAHTRLLELVDNLVARAIARGEKDP